jgi:hypothetical protein
MTKAYKEKLVKLAKEVDVIIKKIDEDTNIDDTYEGPIINLMLRSKINYLIGYITALEE